MSWLKTDLTKGLVYDSSRCLTHVPFTEASQICSILKLQMQIAAGIIPTRSDYIHQWIKEYSLASLLTEEGIVRSCILWWILELYHKDSELYHFPQGTVVFPTFFAEFLVTN